MSRGVPLLLDVAAASERSSRTKPSVLARERKTSLALIEAPSTTLVPVSAVSAASAAELGQVLSPSQVRAFVDCSARWWFKYGLELPEPKNSSLALGWAVFRDEWLEHIRETVFAPEETPSAIAAMGERLLAKYMEEVAPRIKPAVVECDVEGEIGGVRVRGRVDLVDRSGRIIDVKASARRPRAVAPDYAFQLATYAQIYPKASGEARLDTLVRTQFVQVVPLAYRIAEHDLRATRVLYPLVQDGMRSGLYWPNRHSMLCSRRQCAFWRACEREFGGTVKDS
jgi:hypothetical protein